MPKRLLFVCTGNTCRSPMAEGMLRAIARSVNVEVEVRSAGLAAMDGAAISSHSRAVLARRGISDSISSQRLTRDLVNWADLILTMTVSHKRTIVSLYPQALDKTFTLKEYARSADTERVQDEHERLVADLQLKQALAEPVTEAERARLAALERLLPDPDIADPFGGTLIDYEQCGAEIESYLRQVVIRLRVEDGDRA